MPLSPVAETSWWVAAVLSVAFSLDTVVFQNSLRHSSGFGGLCVVHGPYVLGEELLQS